MHLNSIKYHRLLSTPTTSNLGSVLYLQRHLTNSPQLISLAIYGNIICLYESVCVRFSLWCFFMRFSFPKIKWIEKLENSNTFINMINMWIRVEATSFKFNSNCECWVLWSIVTVITTNSVIWPDNRLENNQKLFSLFLNLPWIHVLFLLIEFCGLK